MAHSHFARNPNFYQGCLLSIKSCFSPVLRCYSWWSLERLCFFWHTISARCFNMLSFNSFYTGFALLIHVIGSCPEVLIFVKFSLQDKIGTRRTDVNRMVIGHDLRLSATGSILGVFQGLFFLYEVLLFLSGDWVRQLNTFKNTSIEILASVSLIKILAKSYKIKEIKTAYENQHSHANTLALTSWEDPCRIHSAYSWNDDERHNSQFWTFSIVFSGIL